VNLGSDNLTIANGGAFGGKIIGTGDVDLTGGAFALNEGAQITSTGTTTVASGATLDVVATESAAAAAFQGGSLDIASGGTLRTSFAYGYTLPAGGTVDVYVGNNVTYANSGTAVTVANRLYKVVGDLTYDSGSLFYTLERGFSADLFPRLSPQLAPVIDGYVGGNSFLENLISSSISDDQLDVAWNGTTAFRNGKAHANMVVLPMGATFSTETRLASGRVFTPELRTRYIANVGDVMSSYNVMLPGSPTSALMATRMADRHAGDIGLGFGLTRGTTTFRFDYSRLP
jgi:hypothetical protein